MERYLIVSFMLIGICSALDTTNCGGSYKITDNADTGEIKSPNYPSNYGYLDKCIWKLTAPANYSVQLTIDSFAGQEGHNGSCIDYLEIRDGSFKANLLAQICNTSTTTVVKSSSVWLWVKFYSDYDTINTGFRATWKLVYHGYNSQKNPSALAACKSVVFNCPNEECVSMSYRCDGVNDCGYVGTGSDEDYWCDYKYIGKDNFYAWGFGSGFILCFLVFLLALLLEGYCSCCCPKSCTDKMACHKCMDRLSGKGSHESRNWPKYMKNPAILKLTGDVEGYREYEKFDKERDQRKYEKIRKLKEEEEAKKQEKTTGKSGKVVHPALSLKAGKKTQAQKITSNSNTVSKKGETNIAYEEEIQANTSTKKLTRQKAFNYEEQPQMEDLDFKDGLTPAPSPSPSEHVEHATTPTQGKGLTKKASTISAGGKKKQTPKATEKKQAGRVKGVAQKK